MLHGVTLASNKPQARRQSRTNAPLPPPKTAYHHGNLSAAALAEAKRLLSGPVNRDFTLPEVAKGLGVSHAALYRHFAGKAGLLAALALDGYQRFGAALEAATAGLCGRALLRATAVTYCQFARLEPALFRAMFHPVLRDKSKFPALEHAAATSFGSLGSIVQRLDCGSTLPIALIGAAIWSTLHGAAALESDAWLPGRTGLQVTDLERLVPETLADLLFAGLVNSAH